MKIDDDRLKEALSDLLDLICEDYTFLEPMALEVLKDLIEDVQVHCTGASGAEG